MVVEILSPRDESYEKFPFYAAHGVDEVLIVNTEGQRVKHVLPGRQRGECPDARGGNRLAKFLSRALSGWCPSQEL